MADTADNPTTHEVDRSTPAQGAQRITPVDAVGTASWIGIARDGVRSDWNCFRGTRPPKFVNDSERECAEILDYYGVPWEYEPITFVLETDATGRVTEAFSPDFYLPEQNLFLEVTTMRQELVTRKNRKVRKLRQRYPDVNVKLFYKRDIEALGAKLRSRMAPPPAPAFQQQASDGNTSS